MSNFAPQIYILRKNALYASLQIEAISALEKNRGTIMTSADILDCVKKTNPSLTMKLEKLIASKNYKGQAGQIGSYVGALVANEIRENPSRIFNGQLVKFCQQYTNPETFLATIDK